MSEKFSKIFSSSSGDISQELLLRYAEGKATPEEQHFIEERLADDPFLADALEGLMMAKDKQKASRDIAEIKEEIKRRTQQAQPKIIPWKRILQVAAAVAFLVSGVWLINSMMQKSTEKIFTEEFEPYPPPAPPPVPETLSDAIMPVDSAKPALVDKKSEESKAATTTKKTTSDLSTDRGQTLDEPENEGVTEKQLDESVTAITPAEADEEAEDVKVTTDDQLSKMVQKDSTQAGNSAPAVSEGYNSSASRPQSLKQVELAKEKKTVDVSAPELQEQSFMNNDQLNDALFHYNNNNYVEAVNKFGFVLKEDPDNATANFYSGVSNLALNNSDEALALFKKVDHKSNPFYEASLWYEALAYIQKGEKKNAINSLEKVVKINGEYKTKAEELLKELR